MEKKMCVYVYIHIAFRRDLNLSQSGDSAVSVCLFYIDICVHTHTCNSILNSIFFCRQHYNLLLRILFNVLMIKICATSLRH